MWRLILTIGLGTSLLGCAKNPTQQAALLLVDQLDSYKEQVQGKIAAEQKFYKAIQHTADKAAGRQVWVDQAEAQLKAMIELADQAIVRDKGMQVTLLHSFLREQNRLAATRNQELATRRAELEEYYRISFDTLAFKSLQLASVRSQLLDLSRDRNNQVLLIKTLQQATCLASAQTDTETISDADLSADGQANTPPTDNAGDCK